jgi:Predicted membrane protein
MQKLRDLTRRYGMWALIVLHLLGWFTILVWDPSFARFTPLNLLFSAAVLVLNDEKGRGSRTAFFVFCFLVGYGVELLGTKTGVPFGEYRYGPNLAPLLAGVPLVIGLNWFLLAFASFRAWQNLAAPFLLRALLAAATMVFLDLFIEPVAGPLDYWYWQRGEIPPMNYLAWFGVSLLMQGFGYFALPVRNNPIAPVYLIVVLFFFLGLNLML